MADKREIYPSYNARTKKDWWIFCVYNDSDFRENAIRALDLRYTDQKLSQELLRGLAAEYKITVSDINIFGINRFMYVANTSSLAKLIFNFENDDHRIEFKNSTTRQELIEEVDKFIETRHHLYPIKNTRRKTPSNISLVYAIFIAKKNKLTEKQIFKSYKDGVLPKYSDSNIKYRCVKELLKYYYENKP